MWYLSRNFYFSFRLSNFVESKFDLIILCISSLCVYGPFFVLDFVNLHILLILICLDKGMSSLLIFSKKQLFILFILCIVLFALILLISALSLLFPAIYFLVNLFLFVLERSGGLLSLLCEISPNSLCTHLVL